MGPGLNPMLGEHMGGNINFTIIFVPSAHVTDLRKVWVLGTYIHSRCVRLLGRNPRLGCDVVGGLAGWDWGVVVLHRRVDAPLLAQTGYCWMNSTGLVLTKL